MDSIDVRYAFKITVKYCRFREELQQQQIKNGPSYFLSFFENSLFSFGAKLGDVIFRNLYVIKLFNETFLISLKHLNIYFSYIYWLSEKTAMTKILQIKELPDTLVIQLGKIQIKKV